MSRPEDIRSRMANVQEIEGIVSTLRALAVAHQLEAGAHLEAIRAHAGMVAGAPGADDNGNHRTLGLVSVVLGGHVMLSSHDWSPRGDCRMSMRQGERPGTWYKLFSGWALSRSVGRGKDYSYRLRQPHRGGMTDCSQIFDEARVLTGAYAAIIE